MDPGLDLRPVPEERRTATFWDVLALFAGANVVTTTLVTGGALAPAFSLRQAALLIVLGVALGTLPIAVLARLGPRFGVPTMVLLRRPFGRRGAAAISLLLIVTNFAWIALNNVIAAEACTALLGGPEWAWSLAVGVVAIGIALFGPRAMAAFDKVAVPALAVVGVAITWALFAGPGREVLARGGNAALPWLAGLDIVVGYQVSWSLMFADYTRHQRSETRAAWACGLGLAAASLWLMTLGAGAGLVGGGASPTAMILAVGLPAPALLLMALSTVTTNFVNIYLSSLALKNLWPRAPERGTVLLMGGLGTVLGVVSPRLLDRYADFMGWIATLLLPLLAVAIVHFFASARVGRPSGAPRSEAAWSGARRPRPTPAPRSGAGGVLRAEPAWSWTGMVAWLAGVVTYQALTHLPWRWGATLPTLGVTAALAIAADRWRHREARSI